jgi:hypothetical protein
MMLTLQTAAPRVRHVSFLGVAGSPSWGDGYGRCDRVRRARRRLVMWEDEVVHQRQRSGWSQRWHLKAS